MADLLSVLRNTGTLPKPVAPKTIGDILPGNPSTSSSPTNPLGIVTQNTAPKALVADASASAPAPTPNTASAAQQAADRAAAQQAAQQAEAEARQKQQMQNELNARQTELGVLSPTRDRNLSSIDQRLSSILGGYDTDATRNKADFTDQTNTARGNYDRNLQQALNNAAQGRQGLLSTLASLGALSGSGLTLADRAVQQGANLDIAGANDTLRDNTTSLNRSFNEFTRQDEERRRQAQDEASGLRTTANYNYFNDLANLLTQISNLQGNLGDTGAMNDFAGRAQSALADRSNYAVSPVSAISQQSAAYNPTALAGFQSTAPDVSISATPEGQNVNALLPSLLANIRRRQQEG